MHGGGVRASLPQVAPSLVQEHTKGVCPIDESPQAVVSSLTAFTRGLPLESVSEAPVVPSCSATSRPSPKGVTVGAVTPIVVPAAILDCAAATASALSPPTAATTAAPAAGSSAATAAAASVGIQEMPLSDALNGRPPAAQQPVEGIEEGVDENDHTDLLDDTIESPDLLDDFRQNASLPPPPSHLHSRGSWASLASMHSASPTQTQVSPPQAPPPQVMEWTRRAASMEATMMGLHGLTLPTPSGSSHDPTSRCATSPHHASSLPSTSLLPSSSSSSAQLPAAHREVDASGSRATSRRTSVASIELPRDWGVDEGEGGEASGPQTPTAFRQQVSIERLGGQQLLPPPPPRDEDAALCGGAWPDPLSDKRLCRASAASRNSSRPSSRGTSRATSRVASVADLTAVSDLVNNTAAANTGGDSAPRACQTPDGSLSASTVASSSIRPATEGHQVH